MTPWVRIECRHKTSGGRPVTAYLGDLALVPDTEARFYCKGCRTVFSVKVTGAGELVKKKVRRGSLPLPYSQISVSEDP